MLLVVHVVVLYDVVHVVMLYMLFLLISLFAFISIAPDSIFGIMDIKNNCSYHMSNLSYIK